MHTRRGMPKATPGTLSNVLGTELTEVGEAGDFKASGIHLKPCPSRRLLLFLFGPRATGCIRVGGLDPPLGPMGIPSASCLYDSPKKSHRRFALRLPAPECPVDGAPARATDHQRHLSSGLELAAFRISTNRHLLDCKTSCATTTERWRKVATPICETCTALP